MKNIILTLLTSTALFSASGIVNTDNSWGCISESKNTELNDAVINKDKQAQNYLLSYSCEVLHKGQKVTIIKKDKYGLSMKIRVYPKNRRPKEIYIEPYYVDEEK